MTLQPAGVVAPDAELWATGALRSALAGRSEPYAADVFVGNEKPATNRARMVVVRRDGGPMSGVFDHPRLTVRVWADLEQDASDLAGLVQALLLNAPGDGVCVAATSLSGPSGVPDDSQFQKVLTVEMQLRCTSL